MQATQHVPIVVNKISPNPTLDDITVELESWSQQNISFGFFNMLGTQVRNESRALEQGINQIHFDISELPNGMYMIVPQTNLGKAKTSLFLKQ